MLRWIARVYSQTASQGRAANLSIVAITKLYTRMQAIQFYEAFRRRGRAVVSGATGLSPPFASYVPLFLSFPSAFGYCAVVLCHFRSYRVRLMTRTFDGAKHMRGNDNLFQPRRHTTALGEVLPFFANIANPLFSRFLEAQPLLMCCDIGAADLIFWPRLGPVLSIESTIKRLHKPIGRLSLRFSPWGIYRLWNSIWPRHIDKRRRNRRRSSWCDGLLG